MTDIGGSVEPGFEGVADAFRTNFEEHGEVGAATAVYVGGKKKAATCSGPTRRIASSSAGSESNGTAEACGISGPQFDVFASIPPIEVPKPCVPW